MSVLNILLLQYLIIATVPTVTPDSGWHSGNNQEQYIQPIAMPIQHIHACRNYYMQT